MRVFKRPSGSSQLGRYHKSWFSKIIDPLSPRERVVYSFLLITLIVVAIVPRVTATESAVGTPLILGASQCSSSGDWQFSERATGTAASLTSESNGIDVNNSAILDGRGSLICGGFSQTNDTKLKTQLVLSLGTTNQAVESVAGELNLDAAENAALQLNSLPQSVQANAFGEEVSAGVDDSLEISFSTDNGESWQKLHLVEGSISAYNSQLLSVELPEILRAEIEDLSFRFDPLVVGDSLEKIAIDSVGIAYEVGPEVDITIQATDGTGKVIADEQPVLTADGSNEFELKSKDASDGFWQGVATRAQSSVGQVEEPQIEVETKIVNVKNGDETLVDSEVDWQEFDLSNAATWRLDVDMPESTDPGEYALVVEVVNEDGQKQVLQQNFIWGVLALNTDKTVYTEGETAFVAMSVLDENGATICNAELTLTVEKPGGSRESYATYADTIQRNDSCEIYGPQITADYETSFVLDRLGDYDLELTATTENGTFTITDQISVNKELPFNIRRTGPTRVFPPVTYPMTLELSAQQDFRGKLTEKLPESFEVIDGQFGQDYEVVETIDGSKIITWSVDIKAGETKAYVYRMKAPPISPEFYLLGPAELTDQDSNQAFVEERSWQIAGDAIGDIAIYREATGTEALGTTLTDVAWDTTVTQGSAFTIDGGRTNVDLADAGNYYVSYNIGFETSGGGNRSEMNALIDVGGVDLAYGRSSCFIRRSGGTDECWLSGSAIINASAGDDLKIEALRTDSNTATVQRRAAESGISILKLDDAWDYARISELGGGQTFNATSFAAVDWDNDDELDAGSFSRSGSDITLSTAGKYLVSANVMYQNSSTSARRNNEIRLTLDSAEVPGTRTSAYLRGSNGSQDHAASYTGIINATAGQILRLEGACEGEACGGVTNVGGQTAISIVKLPNSANYLRIYEAGGTQTVDGTTDPITWDTQSEVDSDYSHSTTVNPSRITINTTDDYLFLGSFYADRTSTASGARQYPRWDWRANGTTTLPYGTFGSYNRGSQGGTGTFSSGSSSGVILNNLNATDYVELINTDESTGTDATNVFTGNRNAVQAVNITSLFATAPSTEQAHFRWRDDTTALNTSGGFLAAEDSNAIGAVDKETDLRLRLEVANSGTSAEAAARTYELQFGDNTGINDCTAISTWTGISDSSTDAFEQYDSTSITSDGQATTALLANGEGYTFTAGEGRDITDTSGSIGPLGASGYTELEFSIRPTFDAITGHSYCFRVFDTTAATVLDGYNVFPEIEIDSTAAVFGAYGEAGTFASQPDGGWTTINFLSSYTTPVVVGTTNSQNGQNALVFESRNVTSTSAEMRVCESEGSTSNGCDTHASETVGYLVIDANQTSTIPGIEAGTFTANGQADTNSVTTNYAESFSTTPLVFSNVNTVDSTEFPIEVVISATSTTSFTAGICDHLLGSNDSCDGTHTDETVGWVAIEPGNEPFSIENQNGTASVTNSAWTAVSFSPAFSSTPVLLVSSQTDAGGQDVEIDEGRSVTTAGAEIRFCEIDAGDTCDTHATDTVAWAAFEESGLGEAANLDQDTYRWYENADAIQPTTSLAAENANIVDAMVGDVFRIRMAVQAGEDVSADAINPVLQFGEGADCSAIVTWTNVGGFGDSTEWRGFDNVTPADGADVTASLLNGGGNTLASYVESGEAPLNPNAINDGDRVEYDWVIENNNASGGSNYCFRLATPTGDPIHYTNYPEVTTFERPIQQLHFRWRDDSTDVNTTGGWLAAEDSNAIGDRAKLSSNRLRLEVANTGSSADSVSRQYQLQFADRGPSEQPCTALTTWIGIEDAANDEFEINNTTFIDPDGETLSSALLANTETYNYVNGQGRDETDTTGSIGPLASGDYTEIEYSIMPTYDAVTGHTYCFRVFDTLNSEELDEYAVYPELKIPGSTIDVAIGEFGTVTLTNEAYTTVNTTFTYANPIVVASPRYAQTSAAVPERAPRITNKTSNSFDIKVFNHDGTVTGSTEVDFFVFEEGAHTINTDGGTFQIEAGTTNTSTLVVCNGGTSALGDVINFTNPFAGNPVVLNTVTSDVDGTYVNSHVHGTSFTTSPSSTQFQVGLDRGFDTCAHGAEDIDWIAMQQTSDTHNGFEFQVLESTDNVAGGFTATGYSNSFSPAFGSTPLVAVTALPRIDGANGGISLLHTGGTELSTTTFNTTVEEFGPAADRAHTAEPVGIIAFDAASGAFLSSITLSLDQDGYRFYENNDAVDPTTAIDNENTAITNVGDNEVLRIRVAVQDGMVDLDVGKQAFKLQFSDTVTTCDAAASWTDVGGIGSGAIWRGFDNGTPADGAAIGSSLLNSGGNVLQSYEEENISAANQVALNDGDRGEWDWVIENNGAAYETTYCFRMTTSGGDTMLYTVYPQLTTASAARMILLFDGASIPTDWTCISCTLGDDAFENFLRGEATYGGTGGSATHGHTATGNVDPTTDPALGTTRTGTAEVSEATHGHSFTPTIGDASNLPQYRQLQVIRYDLNSVPTTIPNGAIALFDAAVPAGWTRYSAQDGNYVRGENTIGTTGGSNTHTHAITGTLTAATAPDNRTQPGGTQESVAATGHTHDGSGTSTAQNHEPPYLEVILGQANSDIAFDEGIIAMWDDNPSSDWLCWSCVSGDPLYQRFFKPSATYGTTGGNTTHTHTTTVYSSGTPDITDTTRAGTANGSDIHTHQITVDNYTTANNIPPYLNVIFAKYELPNSAPDTPTSLNQVRVTAATAIGVGDWTNEDQVEFRVSATDPDNPDTIQLCIEVETLGTAFDNTPTSCGTLTAYSGTAITLLHTVTGLADGQYHWQALVRDDNSVDSAWVSFGGNAETARDFGIDTSAPSGTVFDGTTVGVDVDFNSGELDELSANWNINSNISGLSLYEYSIGTSPAATDVVTWTSNGTTDNITVSSLSLSTSQPYYFNVRTTDNAGNESIISSDGLFVAPTISFSTSPGNVAFETLNSGNNFEDTEISTLTTSTNALNGYVIRAFLDGVLTSANGDTVGLFDGGTYAAPDEWLTGDRGYGYTSNDNDVQGSNIFLPGTCLGGGSPPCYAPFSLAAPGDIVADNPGPVIGTPINNENFIVTHRVKVDSDQEAGQYQTFVIYTITATY